MVFSSYAHGKNTRAKNEERANKTNIEDNDKDDIESSAIDDRFRFV